MIFDDICVFELDVTLLFFREILNIFRCFSEYWKILKVSKSRNLCVRRRADLQKVHSQPGLEVGYVSRVSMRKKSFGIDCLQKSYSIIYYYYCYNYHHHYYYYYYYYYDYILCMIFSVLILSDNFDTVGAQRAGHTRSFVSLKCIYMAVCQNLVPLVNIKIAGIYGCSSH